MNNPQLAQTIGIVGGGQLGKMMAVSAKRQGHRVIILDPTPDCPAAQVSDEHIVCAYDDAVGMEELVQKSTVLTYEFENIDSDLLDKMTTKTNFPQTTKPLRLLQNRIQEKSFLESIQVPVGKWFSITTEVELIKAMEELHSKAVLKTTRFGYDGKGQFILKNREDIPNAIHLLQSGECILEQFIPFEKELSVMISRNVLGETSIFPVSENIHRENILHLSIVPARIDDAISRTVQQLAIRIANELNLVGTLGIECFLMQDGSFFVNEIAPRPHNSGHYSIEACNFSQFDTSIQSVLQLPMPDIQLFTPVVMVNVLGQHVDQVFALKSKKKNWHFHDYGKHESKHNRKMGHITILTKDIEQTLQEIQETTIWRN